MRILVLPLMGPSEDSEQRSLEIVQILKCSDMRMSNIHITGHVSRGFRKKSLLNIRAYRSLTPRGVDDAVKTHIASVHGRSPKYSGGVIHEMNNFHGPRTRKGTDIYSTINHGHNATATWFQCLGTGRTFVPWKIL